MRKIIQVVDSPETQNYAGCIIALCNDGTFWWYQDRKWTLVPVPIPQDDV